MKVDFDKFLRWCENKFDDVSVSGNEIKINSVFCEDNKKHLWCTCGLGNFGAYHCWKSDNSGNLIKLVMTVEKCSFNQASNLICNNDNIRDVEEYIDKLLNGEEKEINQKSIIQNKVKFPDDTHEIDKLPKGDYYKDMAETFLYFRKIPTKNLYVCKSDNEFKERIIIPYINRQGELVYYNSRYIGSNKNVLRYLGLKKEKYGVGKGDVVFMAQEWPEDGTQVCFTEGEFNAMSLRECGFKSGAFGSKNVTENHINIIRKYVPVICFDNDKYGKAATISVSKNMQLKGIDDVFYVFPPEKYKDWNDMLEKETVNDIKMFVIKNIKRYDGWEGI